MYVPHSHGGILDGTPVDEAKKKGVDLTIPALWKLSSGVVVSLNISVIDLTVALILGRSKG